MGSGLPCTRVVCKFKRPTRSLALGLHRSAQLTHHPLRLVDRRSLCRSKASAARLGPGLPSATADGAANRNSSVKLQRAQTRVLIPRHATQLPLERDHPFPSFHPSFCVFVCILKKTNKTKHKKLPVRQNCILQSHPIPAPAVAVVGVAFSACGFSATGAETEL